MKLLNVCSDSSVIDKKSDTHQRMIDYGNLLEEFHIQIFSNNDSSIKISENVWVHSISKNKKLYSIKAFIACVKIIKKYKIDCVASPGPVLTGFFALFLKFLLKTKLLVSVYGANIYDKFWYTESISRLIYRFTLGPIPFIFADAIQTDGLETYRYLQKKFGVKVFLKYVIPNNISNFLRIKRTKNESLILKVLFIGRMTKQKNINFLSKVIRQFSSNKKIIFRVIGNGELKEYFFKKNNKLIESGKIIYSEKINRDDMIGEFNNSSFLLLTSRYEGFPRVFLEAAASAMPIITTKVSGVENLIQDGVNGFIVNQDDLDSFVKKINILINNRELIFDMGQKNRILFMNNFIYEKTIEQQKIIFNSLNKQ